MCAYGRAHTPHQPFLLSLPAWCSASLLGTVSGEIQVWKACAAGNGGTLVSRNIGKASISLAVRCPYMFACTSSQIWIHSPKAHPCATPRCGTGHRCRPGPQDWFFFSIKVHPFLYKCLCSYFLQKFMQTPSLLFTHSVVPLFPFPEGKHTQSFFWRKGYLLSPFNSVSETFFSPTHPESIGMCVFLCNCVLPIREKESREKEKKRKKNNRIKAGGGGNKTKKKRKKNNPKLRKCRPQSSDSYVKQLFYYSASWAMALLD